MRNMDVYNGEIKKLAERVAAQQTVSESAAALIVGLRARINELITTSDGIVPVEELQKLSSSIDVGTKALAEAVEANTIPPAPVEAPAPVPADPVKPGETPADPQPKPAE